MTGRRTVSAVRGSRAIVLALVSLLLQQWTVASAECNTAKVASCTVPTAKLSTRCTTSLSQLACKNAGQCAWDNSTASCRFDSCLPLKDYASCMDREGCWPTYKERLLVVRARDQYCLPVATAAKCPSTTCNMAGRQKAPANWLLWSSLAFAGLRSLSCFFCD